MGKIKMIRTGGQSGVDRASLDTARKMGVPICGVQTTSIESKAFDLPRRNIEKLRGVL